MDPAQPHPVQALAEYLNRSRAHDQEFDVRVLAQDCRHRPEHHLEALARLIEATKEHQARPGRIQLSQHFRLPVRSSVNPVGDQHWVAGEHLYLPAPGLLRDRDAGVDLFQKRPQSWQSELQKLRIARRGVIGRHHGAFGNRKGQHGIGR